MKGYLFGAVASWSLGLSQTRIASSSMGLLLSMVLLQAPALCQESNDSQNSKGSSSSKKSELDKGVKAQSDVDFGPYMAELQRRVKRAWFPPLGTESKKVTALWKIHSDGRVSDVKIDKSSTNKNSDDAALAAINSAAPFRPLPQGSPEVVDIQFTFDYNVFSGARPRDRENLDEVHKPYTAAAGKSDAAALAWEKLGVRYREESNDKLAISSFKSAIDVLNKDSNSNKVLFADISTELADVYYDRDEYAKAEPLYRQALETRIIIADKSPEAKQSVAESRRDLAYSIVYKDDGDLNEAKGYFEEDLPVAEELNDQDLVFDLKHGLSIAYWKQGDFPKALPLFQWLLLQTKNSKGESLPLLAARTKDLADCYYELAQFEKALPLYEKALASNTDDDGLSGDDLDEAKSRREEISEKLGKPTAKQIAQQKATNESIEKAYVWLPFALGGTLFALAIIYAAGSRQNSSIDLSGKEQDRNRS